MNLATMLAIITLVFASYLASLVLALLRTRRSALQRRFEELGRPDDGAWIISNRDSVIITVSFLRTVMRLAFFASVLVAIVGLGEEQRMSLSDLFLSGGIATLLIWLSTSVLSNAIAEHAGTGLILRSMPLLRICAFIGRPAASGLSFIDEAVRRLAGASPRDEQEVEAELLRSIEDTQREGGLDPDAATMLENVVEFRSTDVAAIMTPRTDIEGIELTDDLARIRTFITEAGHSRIPVYTDNLDHIVGILYIKDLIRYLGTDVKDFKLKATLRKPLVVPETKSLPELLADFQKHEVHLAIVIDEYGGTAGLVTIEDVLEEIVGEIYDEHEPEDEEIPEFTSVDERRAEVDGRFHIDDLNELMPLELPEDEDYETVGGYLMSELGRVPEVGEVHETPRARFIVLEATETNIRKIGIELTEPQPAASEQVEPSAASPK